jgi:hypothetical protein
MPNKQDNRGGSDNRKSTSGQQGSKDTTEQQKQSGGSKSSQQGSGSTQGGTPEQHAKAGEQSHKINDRLRLRPANSLAGIF